METELQQGKKKKEKKKKVDKMLEKNIKSQGNLIIQDTDKSNKAITFVRKLG